MNHVHYQCVIWPTIPWYQGENVGINKQCSPDFYLRHKEGNIISLIEWFVKKKKKKSLIQERKPLICLSSLVQFYDKKK